jgi:hypothetical protein
MNGQPSMHAGKLSAGRRLKARKIKGGPVLFSFQTSRFDFSAGGRGNKSY